MKITKDFVDLKVEIPTLQESKEGYLVGGFVASPCNGEIGAEAPTPGLNIGSCTTNTNCQKCVVDDTTPDTTEETTEETTGNPNNSIANFAGLFFSGLF